MNKSETVTISRNEYDRLLKDSKFLAHLEANGVDNWEGYAWPDTDDDDEEGDDTP